MMSLSEKLRSFSPIFRFESIFEQVNKLFLKNSSTGGRNTETTFKTVRKILLKNKLVKNQNTETVFAHSKHSMKTANFQD